MAIENLKDIVTRQLESKYILGEKVFEAKNFTVYIATHRENSLASNLLVLIRHLYNENPSVHIWHKKISMEATELEITKEVTEAIQSGFVNEE
ncbi:hypothetical protein ABEX41_11250 [Bacillus tropicus]|uniref:Uncharacterized protein n=1 Tax=Bacillus tropicus TaxID=2026188 RepID=A0A5C5A8E0_9BACI|nr:MULTISPECIES: hypothetical protein [Bacillus]ALL23323.1 hypothetical protein BTXL6_18615 [Bacillus thuringiensis]EEM23175.1 hypothetical protein bthur0001_16580 [Bacillus thuringiensis serovar tochigiensis BGSC 4Y1]OOL09306.1 hypothetical protein BHL37_25615 [Bacillus cereus]KXO04913.1 hypothetical protein AYK81_23350 [Bacillus thuringiensis]MCB4844671.1 hypothetical protein [Bacillus tropicus]